MNFEEAEARFRQLQGRVQRGEPISRAEYEEEVSKLAVQDKNGVLWEINPRTGKWMYFDGAEWVSGAPPGRDTSTVMPIFQGLNQSAPASAPVESPKQSTPPQPAPIPVALRASATPPVRQAPQSPRRSQARPVSRGPASMPPGDDVPSAQRQDASGGRSNREWIPFAIGAVVLLVCAVLVFAASRLVPMLMPQATATKAVVIPLTTSTKVPTPVLLPSPTPLPPTPAPVLAQAPDGGNVRDKPSTTGKIVTKLAKNAQVTLLAVGPADGANVWYQINVPEKSGVWIRSDVVQVVSGDPKTLPPAGGTATPAAPAATKPPAVAQPTATPTVIGVIAPTPKTYP